MNSAECWPSSLTALPAINLRILPCLPSKFIIRAKAQNSCQRFGVYLGRITGLPNLLIEMIPFDQPSAQLISYRAMLKALPRLCESEPKKLHSMHLLQAGKYTFSS